MENRQHWQDWLTGIVGVWLIVSPWVLGYATPADGAPSVVTWNFILSGAVAIVFAGAALMAYRMWEEWVEVILGLWLIASPWILQFTASDPAFWSAVLGGVVIVLSAGWSLFEEQQAGHA